MYFSRFPPKLSDPPLEKFTTLIALPKSKFSDLPIRVFLKILTPYFRVGVGACQTHWVMALLSESKSYCFKPSWIFTKQAEEPNLDF